MTFDLQEWRRELEQALARPEPIVVRVLLDRLETEWEVVQSEADYWLDAAHGEAAPEAEPKGSCTPCNSCNSPSS